MPKLATALVAVAAAVTLAVVLTRPTGSTSASGEVFLQPVSQSGPDPFMESVATKEAPPPASRTPSGYSTAPTAPAPTSTMMATRSISGAAPGVYGGTKDVASCDVEKQIKVLSGDPAKNAAFASSVGIEPAAVPGYLRSLTPVQLAMDTRVTNHGYSDGKAYSYQAVLQAGTAVLVDDRGVPRVRCACGNPLAQPVALKANPKRYGQPWTAYQPAKVVVIAPSVKVVKRFVIYDHEDRQWYERAPGHHDKGTHDRPVPPPPVIPTPSWSPWTPTGTRPPTHTPSHTWTGSPTEKVTTGTPTGKETTKTPTGKETTKTPRGKETTGTGTPTGKETTKTPTGEETTKTPTGEEATKTPGGKETTKTPTGEEATKTPGGKETTKTPTGEEATKTPGGKVTTGTPAGEETTKTPGGKETTGTGTPTGEETAKTPGGKVTTGTPAGEETAKTPGGKVTTGTPAGEETTKTPTDKEESTETSSGYPSDGGQ